MGMEAEELKLLPSRVAHAACPACGSGGRLGCVLPLQLLIGVAEKVGGQIQLRGHAGRGGGLNQRADVCDQGADSTIDQLANFGQAAVESCS